MQSQENLHTCFGQTSRRASKDMCLNAWRCSMPEISFVVLVAAQTRRRRAGRLPRSLPLSRSSGLRRWARGSTRLRCDRIHRDAAVEAWEGRGREVELGTVEGSEKSVARGVSPRVRESAEFLSQQVVVGAEQFVPSMVAELSSAFCRSHDIGEHNPEASREYLGYSLDQIASLEREGVLLRRRPLKNCEV